MPILYAGVDMEFSERVLLLRVGKFKESDLWIRFLSPTRGVLTAFAFGGSRSRRRFIGCLDIFNEVCIKAVSSGHGAYLALCEGVLIKGVPRLRSDPPRLGIAANCAAFLQTFGVTIDGAQAAYFLFHQTLQLLEEEESLPGLLPFFFRARLVFDQGYALETRQCMLCGKLFQQEKAYLFLKDGLFFCHACSSLQLGQRLALSVQALEALGKTHVMPPVSWGKLQLVPSVARECARVIDGFIQYHVGIHWENGHFVRH
ncbi:MAG: DNA repair protein RecO [Desulfovibrio sp.]|jgi:DNA repair protein RecO (recombination protein O)|nr:DNA repair protein RecO [Desulfovibrio sp.]